MLYIVGTPIVNLQDLSYRQAKTLSESEIILSEDTRSTPLLLQRIQELFNFSLHPEQKVVSYYKDIEFQKLPQILEWLEEEKQVSLISEAGMPGLSDPGHLLISTAVKRNIPFTVIPGPTALVTALVASGFKLSNFYFLGFLPKKSSELQRLVEKIKQIKQLLPETVFAAYESPERLHKTLELVSETLPESNICIAREMTKKFEEIVRGKASKLFQREYKGEITILLE